jgi:hypothetical protein
MEVSEPDAQLSKKQAIGVPNDTLNPSAMGSGSSSEALGLRDGSMVKR